MVLWNKIVAIDNYIKPIFRFNQYKNGKNRLCCINNLYFINFYCRICNLLNIVFCIVNVIGLLLLLIAACIASVGLAQWCSELLKYYDVPSGIPWVPWSKLFVLPSYIARGKVMFSVMYVCLFERGPYVTSLISSPSPALVLPQLPHGPPSTCRKFSNFCLIQGILQWWSLRKYILKHTQMTKTFATKIILYNLHFIRDSRVTLEFF